MRYPYGDEHVDDWSRKARRDARLLIFGFPLALVICVLAYALLAWLVR